MGAGCLVRRGATRGKTEGGGVNGHLLRAGLRLQIPWLHALPFPPSSLAPPRAQVARWPDVAQGLALGAPATLGTRPPLATWKMEVSFCRGAWIHRLPVLQHPHPLTRAQTHTQLMCPLFPSQGPFPDYATYHPHPTHTAPSPLAA